VECPFDDMLGIDMPRSAEVIAFEDVVFIVVSAVDS